MLYFAEDSYVTNSTGAQSVSQQLFGDFMSEYLGEKFGIILIYSDRTFGPDVDISTGVSCDSISILSKRYAQHILWLLMFLERIRVRQRQREAT